MLDIKVLAVDVVRSTLGSDATITIRVDALAADYVASLVGKRVYIVPHNDAIEVYFRWRAPDSLPLNWDPLPGIGFGPIKTAIREIVGLQVYGLGLPDVTVDVHTPEVKVERAEHPKRFGNLAPFKVVNLAKLTGEELGPLLEDAVEPVPFVTLEGRAGNDIIHLKFDDDQIMFTTHPEWHPDQKFEQLEGDGLWTSVKPEEPKQETYMDRPKML